MNVEVRRLRTTNGKNTTATASSFHTRTFRPDKSPPESLSISNFGRSRSTPTTIRDGRFSIIRNNKFGARDGNLLCEVREDETTSFFNYETRSRSAGRSRRLIGNNREESPKKSNLITSSTSSTTQSTSVGRNIREVSSPGRSNKTISAGHSLNKTEEISVLNTKSTGVGRNLYVREEVSVPNTRSKSVGRSLNIRAEASSPRRINRSISAGRRLNNSRGEEVSSHGGIDRSASFGRRRLYDSGVAAAWQQKTKSSKYESVEVIQINTDRKKKNTGQIETLSIPSFSKKNHEVTAKPKSTNTLKIVKVTNTKPTSERRNDSIHSGMRMRRWGFNNNKDSSSTSVSPFVSNVKSKSKPLSNLPSSKEQQQQGLLMDQFASEGDSMDFRPIKKPVILADSQRREQPNHNIGEQQQQKQQQSLNDIYSPSVLEEEEYRDDDTRKQPHVDTGVYNPQMGDGAMDDGDEEDNADINSELKQAQSFASNFDPFATTDLADDYHSSDLPVLTPPADIEEEEEEERPPSLSSVSAPAKAPSAASQDDSEDSRLGILPLQIDDEAVSNFNVKQLIKSFEHKNKSILGGEMQSNKHHDDQNEGSDQNDELNMVGQIPSDKNHDPFGSTDQKDRFDQTFLFNIEDEDESIESTGTSEEEIIFSSQHQDTIEDQQERMLDPTAYAIDDNEEEYGGQEEVAEANEEEEEDHIAYHRQIAKHTMRSVGSSTIIGSLSSREIVYQEAKIKADEEEEEEAFNIHHHLRNRQQQTSSKHTARSLDSGSVFGNLNSDFSSLSFEPFEPLTVQDALHDASTFFSEVNDDAEDNKEDEELLFENSTNQAILPTQSSKAMLAREKISSLSFQQDQQRKNGSSVHQNQSSTSPIVWMKVEKKVRFNKATEYESIKECISPSSPGSIDSADLQRNMSIDQDTMKDHHIRKPKNFFINDNIGDDATKSENQVKNAGRRPPKDFFEIATSYLEQVAKNLDEGLDKAAVTFNKTMGNMGNMDRREEKKQRRLSSSRRNSTNDDNCNREGPPQDSEQDVLGDVINNASATVGHAAAIFYTKVDDVLKDAMDNMNELSQTTRTKGADSSETQMNDNSYRSENIFSESFDSASASVEHAATAFNTSVDNGMLIFNEALNNFNATQKKSIQNAPMEGTQPNDHATLATQHSLQLEPKNEPEAKPNMVDTTEGGKVVSAGPFAGLELENNDDDADDQNIVLTGYDSTDRGRKKRSPNAAAPLLASPQSFESTGSAASAVEHAATVFYTAVDNGLDRANAIINETLLGMKNNARTEDPKPAKQELHHSNRAVIEDNDIALDCIIPSAACCLRVDTCMDTVVYPRMNHIFCLKEPQLSGPKQNEQKEKEEEEDNHERSIKLAEDILKEERLRASPAEEQLKVKKKKKTKNKEKDKDKDTDKKDKKGRRWSLGIGGLFKRNNKKGNRTSSRADNLDESNIQIVITDSDDVEVESDLSERSYRTLMEEKASTPGETTSSINNDPSPGAGKNKKTSGVKNDAIVAAKTGLRSAPFPSDKGKSQTDGRAKDDASNTRDTSRRSLYWPGRRIRSSSGKMETGQDTPLIQQKQNSDTSRSPMKQPYTSSSGNMEQTTKKENIIVPQSQQNTKPVNTSPIRRRRTRTRSSGNMEPTRKEKTVSQLQQRQNHNSPLRRRRIRSLEQPTRTEITVTTQQQPRNNKPDDYYMTPKVITEEEFLDSIHGRDIDLNFDLD